MWRRPLQRSTLLILLTFTWQVESVSADDLSDQMRGFLRKHCHECHGPKKQQNDYRFDNLSGDLSTVRTLETWQDILDQVNRGDMPPPGKPKPTEKELVQFVSPLTKSLRAAYARRRSTGGNTVIRRLNRYELRNTLRDLLYLNGASYRPGAVARLVDNNGNGRVERSGSDPVREFPEDENEQGFVNIGDRLVMSDFLLKLTLQAAQETLASATHTGPRPNVKTRRLGGHLVKRKQYGAQTIETVSREMNSDYDLLVQRYRRFGRLCPTELERGVGTSARYRITIEASGHNQRHPWSELLPTNQEQPFELGLHLADTRNGGISGPTSEMVAKFKLPGDGKRRRFQFESWIDSSWTLWLGWENGPYDRQFRADRLVEKYVPASFTPRPDRKKVSKQAFDAWPIDMARALLKHGYRGPHIRLYSVTVEPLIDTWPPKSHTQLYGAAPKDDKQIEPLLRRFAERAYRRPITKDEILPYAGLVRRLMKPPQERAQPPIQDLQYRVFHGKWTRLPKFDTLKPATRGRLIDGLIDLRQARTRDYFGMVFEGTLKATRAGMYKFQLASDDGARLIVGGKKVIEHDGLHGASKRKGRLQLSAGSHDIRLEYFAYGLPNSLQLWWTVPGGSEAPLSVAPTSSRPLSTGDEETSRAISALQAGYTAILCSPRFLYLQETGGRLSSHELASRLSYFLWSSMPDERLFSLAKSRQLEKPDVLTAEVERMLKDPKAAAFMRAFPVAWLRLDKLGKMPPEKAGPFRFYHDRKMEPMLVAQTTAYFSHIVDNNGPIREFIDSDYTFMNETIAEWIYQRKDIGGEAMQKVALNDRRRGGMFTQPSVMTATANGVDTSPVVRGVFVLENILGTPPAPPPPDIEPLPSDLRGAKTIRDQLAIHRKQQACNRCHRKIDPLGFAMENFDPVGRWRDMYPTKPRVKIDPSATLSNGKKVADIIALKQMLLERHDDVARCLTEKLLTYASGRRLEATDRGEIERIIEESSKRGHGVRDLIKIVVRSRIFLNK